MNKKILIIPIAVFIIAVGALFSQDTEQVESELITNEKTLQVDIVMPNKSSRPGCEETNSCYIPPEFSIKSGDSVTWQNQDVAFHSVTSGSYDEPTELFDSGHLDPDELFTLTFDENGIYDYFCTLHPWMKGKIIVES